MRTLSKSTVILGIVIFLLIPSLLFALDDLLDAPGINPQRETLPSIPKNI